MNGGIQKKSERKKRKRSWSSVNTHTTREDDVSRVYVYTYCTLPTVSSASIPSILNYLHALFRRVER